MVRKFVWILISIIGGMAFLGCGSDNGSVSSGLKIFVTAEKHVSDFANDPTLKGNNAIEKADSFCNGSSNKPNNSTYKALIVDGTTRNAVTSTNWVLLPNTAYYRPYNNVVIDTTSSSSIFSAYWRNMSNGFDDCSGPDCFVWTGIDDPATFATNGGNCAGWSGTGSHGRFGYSSNKTAGAFTDGISGACTGNIGAKIYCVEQPI